MVFAILVGLAGVGGPANAAAGIPTVSVAADKWHVNAVLSGVDRFVFVIKVAGQPDKYFGDQPSSFLVDPWIYGGQPVFVSARAEGPTENPWAAGVTFVVNPPKPVVTVAADGWRVHATLPGTSRFTFVIKVTGQPDRYFGDQVSPFLVDPWVYGGRAVFVSARAEGPVTNPWSGGVTFTVSPPKPIVTVSSDGWHVHAELPGTDRFVFVVKVTGLPDRYFGDQPSPFTIDRDLFGGRQVSVSARAEGPTANPWAPEHRFIVPARKLYGVDDVNGGLEGAGPEARAMGVTINRLNFTFGDTQQTMDAVIDKSVRSGLTPLVILNQHGQISQFDLPAWRQWAGDVVARYGRGGTFWAGRTDGELAPTYFEVLNEPYGEWFNSPVEPQAYAHFFAEVVSAADARNTNAKFLLSSLPHIFKVSAAGQWSTKTWDELVKSSVDGSRAQQLADGVTVHPYGSYVATNKLGWHSAVATHNNYPQLPVWITEVGFRINEVVDGVTVTEAVQAQWLARGLADFSDWPWAQAYVWFKWADYYGPDPENMWGVVRHDGTHRPSYDAYRDFIAGSASSEKVPW